MQEKKKRMRKRELRKRLALLLVAAMLLVPFENITGMSVLNVQIAEAAAPDMSGVAYPYFANEPATAVSGSAIGSPEQPLEISNAQQLLNLAYLTSYSYVGVNSNGEAENKNYYIESEGRYASYAECSYVLTGDISLVAYSNWVPIGTAAYPFQGTLDGKNHTISNMTIQFTDGYDNSKMGLFGLVRCGTLKNITLSSSKITGTISSKAQGIGLLVGCDNGYRPKAITIENCHTTDSCQIDITSTAFDPIVSPQTNSLSQVAYCTELVGGLVGSLCGIGNTASVVNCSNKAQVQCSGIKNVGGIIGGMTNGSITECINSGQIAGNRSVGGIAGDASDAVEVRLCENNGNVTALEYSDDIWNSFETASQSIYQGATMPTQESGLRDYGAGYFVGGIIGHNSENVSYCKNSGTVTGCSSVGGISGVMSSNIQNSLNTGEVKTFTYTERSITIKANTILNPDAPDLDIHFKATQEDVGGIAGSVDSDSAVIMDSGNTGDVSGATGVAGILGSWGFDEDTVNTCPVQYCYNTGTIQVSIPGGGGPLLSMSQNTQSSYYLVPDASGAYGKTTEQFSSGEVCYLLDTDEKGARRNIWSQKLKTDEVPVSTEIAASDDMSGKVFHVVWSEQFTGEEAVVSEKYCNYGTKVSDLGGYTSNGYTYSYYYLENDVLGEMMDASSEITYDMTIAVKCSKNASTGGGSHAVVPAPTRKPTETPTPTPTETQKPAETPTPIPAETQEPTETPTPAEIQEPAETPTPAQTSEPSQSSEPSSTPEPTSAPSLTTGKDEKKIVSGGVEYKAAGVSSAKVTDVKAGKKNVVIPDTVTVEGKKLKVTTISADAFANNQKVTSVTLGKNVKKVGNRAFKNCKNLTKITFSNKTALIGKQSFANCSKLQKVSMPDSVKTIGNKAFYNCKKLKNVKIGTKPSNKKKGSLTADSISGTQTVKYGKLELKISIGNSAFQNCKNLRSVIVNTQVSVIGNSAFKNCKKLSSIIVRSLILKTVGKKALVGVSECKISVPEKKFLPYKKLFKNKGQGKKVFVAKAS